MRQGWYARVARAGLIAWGLSAAVGCRADRVAPPEHPAPGAARPSAAIPGDLDVAVRADLVGLRRALGPEFLDSIELDLVSDEGDPPGAQLLREALQYADVVWVAFRPGLRPELTDNVIIVQGNLAGFDPQAHHGESTWSAPIDLGGAWRLYEREPTDRRSAPVRLYVRADELAVALSEAEIDSVERAVELRAGDEHVDPPDRGTLSVAARVQPLLAYIGRRFPRVVDTLRGASLLSGYLTLDALGLRAEFELQFVDSGDARAASDQGGALLQLVASGGGPWAELARNARLNAVGTRSVLTVRLGPDGVGRLFSTAKQSSMLP